MRTELYRFSSFYWVPLVYCNRPANEVERGGLEGGGQAGQSNIGDRQSKIIWPIYSVMRSAILQQQAQVIQVASGDDDVDDEEEEDYNWLSNNVITDFGVVSLIGQKVCCYEEGWSF